MLTGLEFRVQNVPVYRACGQASIRTRIQLSILVDDN